MMCLGCQRGFQGTPQEDSYEKIIAREKLQKLKEKLQKIENMIEEENIKPEQVIAKSVKKRKKEIKCTTQKKNLSKNR